jgi:hypothetical protein
MANMIVASQLHRLDGKHADSALGILGRRLLQARVVFGFHRRAHRALKSTAPRASL